MKKLAEEMQSLVVDTDEIVKDSYGLVTEFRLSDWNWDEKRGWVPKPFKDRIHTKRKYIYEHLPSSPEPEHWQSGFVYRKVTPRRNIRRDNSKLSDLRDLLPGRISAHFDRSVLPVPIRCPVKAHEAKPADSELQPGLGTIQRTTPGTYEPVRNPILCVLPEKTTSDKLSEQANKLWKYSSKKRKWDLLSL